MVARDGGWLCYLSVCVLFVVVTYKKKKTSSLSSKATNNHVPAQGVGGGGIVCDETEDGRDEDVMLGSGRFGITDPEDDEGKEGVLLIRPNLWWWLCPGEYSLY